MNYNILGEILFSNSLSNIRQQLEVLKKDRFDHLDQIVIRQDVVDEYLYSDGVGTKLIELQKIINQVDISNCFILLVTANKDVSEEIKFVTQFYSIDPTPIEFVLIKGEYNYEAANNDISKCLPRLSDDGVLAIDDYKIPGVAQAIENLHKLKTDWVPFLRAEQTEFWHHCSCDRNNFLDLLFVDDLSNFIFVNNVIDCNNNVICTTKSLRIFTDLTKFFTLALKHYNI